jgi:redox-sensing transcriptional repressor
MLIVAAFDTDPEKIGQRIHGREVQPLMFLPDFVRQHKIQVGVVATPAEAAQSVTNLMVSGGIQAIWSFAPTHIHVPAGIILQNEDLYHSLASLSFKLESKLGVSPVENGISYAEDN